MAPHPPQMVRCRMPWAMLHAGTTLIALSGVMMRLTCIQACMLYPLPLYGSVQIIFSLAGGSQPDT